MLSGLYPIRADSHLSVSHTQSLDYLESDNQAQSQKGARYII